MKSALLLTLFLSLSVFAEEGEIHPAYMKTFQMIDEVHGKTFEYKACASDDPNAPEYCKNLYEYICSQKKSVDRRGKLDKELMNKFWRDLPRSLTHKRFNDTVKASHQIAEDSVFKLTGISRSDIRYALTDVKTALYKFISPTRLINEKYKSELIRRMSSVQLIYGKEYVEILVKNAKGNTPKEMSEEEVRVHANKLYMSVCGMSGLEVNAFFEGGYLVLCPGLVISMSEYGRSSQETLAALKFTIGHEIGHSIDSAVYPDVYKKMQACYEDVSGSKDIWNVDMAAEITADYWGALALGSNLPNMHIKALDPEQPEVNARILAIATDGFCSNHVESGSPHPESTFRTNQILAKHPYLARALNCAPSKKDAPYCSLNGSYSN